MRKKWCITLLDYPQTRLNIIAENWREFHVRAKSCQKEPETIAWLKSNCQNQEVLYDIGANIGAYSLVGASLGAQVLAFEPSFSNFNRLNENVTLNLLDSKIQCYQVAFSRTKKIGLFQFLDATPGSSACYYNESGKFNSKLKSIESSKAILVYTLDSFIEEFRLPYPTLMKIDVDGAELEILHGALKTLRNPDFKKMIIEVDHRIVPESEFLSFMGTLKFQMTGKFPRGAEQVFNYTFERSQL